jgi:hypothetical protein
MNVREFLVAEPWLARLHARLVKLNDKARAYGVAEFALTELGERFVRIEHAGTPMRVRAVLVRLSGEPIAKGPWALVAALDERAGSRRLTMYRQAPVAASYLADPMHCEHCKVQRARRRTFIVMHTEDGFTEQVGRQCLADYTGISLARASAGLRLMRALDSLSAQAAETLAEPRYGTTEPYGLDHVLALACAVVRQHGWARAQASETLSSRDRLALALRSAATAPASAVDVEEARAVRVAANAHYAANPEVEREFDARVRSILHTGEVLPRELGLVAWLAHRFRSVCTTEPVSQHVGTLGQRLTVRVRVERVSSLYTDSYGARHEAVHLRDEAGNRLMWKTARRPFAMSADSWLTVRGTVQAHSVWRDQAQTELARVTVRPSEPSTEPPAAALTAAA